MSGLALSQPAGMNHEELEAEADELRQAIRDLLWLKQMRDDGVSGQRPLYAASEAAAWKLAAELVHFEDGPAS
jgi:hypothetical protein